MMLYAYEKRKNYEKLVVTVIDGTYIFSAICNLFTVYKCCTLKRTEFVKKYVFCKNIL